MLAKRPGIEPLFSQTRWLFWSKEQLCGCYLSMIQKSCLI